ncbi:TetR/AcrR family transcriptional regulator [Kineococcus sp. GCM10028916]|uniref:TetR/AcrR family transcriptional regulator n=1 Tax=Kineococcus sp. GCM10028916 TaxID=3273394 RepID=UPI00363FFB7D
MSEEKHRGTRRQESAAETRRLVLGAALQEFTRSGYTRCTAADIARAAGVSVATVYTSVGPKPDLLEALVREGIQSAHVAEALERVAGADSGHDVLHAIANGTGATWQERADVITVLLGSAAAEPRGALLLAEAQTAYRSALDRAAERLVELSALRPGIDAAQASVALWFYFGLHSWPRLVDEAGWSWQEAESWLLTAAARTLLPEPTAVPRRSHDRGTTD